MFVVEALLSDYSEVYYDFLPCYDTYKYLVDIFQNFVGLSKDTRDFKVSRTMEIERKSRR